jgi:hypothetical protein
LAQDPLQLISAKDEVLIEAKEGAVAHTRPPNGQNAAHAQDLKALAKTKHASYLKSLMPSAPQTGKQFSRVRGRAGIAAVAIRGIRAGAGGDWREKEEKVSPSHANEKHEKNGTFSPIPIEEILKKAHALSLGEFHFFHTFH